MTIFDVLFVALCLATVTAVITVFAQLFRRRSRQAVRVLAVYAVCLALYLCALIAVSLTAPQRVLAIGEDRCFDDWCIAVDAVDTTDVLGQGEDEITADGAFYIVTLRLSNHGRGRPQRASSTAVRLRDGRGRIYDVSPRGQEAYESVHGPAVPLTATLEVGTPVVTVRVFELPADAGSLGLTVEHPEGFGPGRFVISDESSFLHKPTLIRLP
jgi:hypothetical protein